MPKRGRLSSPGPSRRVRPQPKCSLPGCTATYNLVICGRCHQTFCNNGDKISHMVFHLQEYEQYPKSIIIPPQSRVLCCSYCETSTHVYNLLVDPHTNDLVCKSGECFRTANLTGKKQFLIQNRFIHSAFVKHWGNDDGETDRESIGNPNRTHKFDSFDHYKEYWISVLEKDLEHEENKIADITLTVNWTTNDNSNEPIGYFENSDIYHSNLFYPGTRFYLLSGPYQVNAKIIKKPKNSSFNSLYFHIETNDRYYNRTILQMNEFTIKFRVNVEMKRKIEKVYSLIATSRPETVLSSVILDTIVSGKVNRRSQSTTRDQQMVTYTLPKANSYETFGILETDQNRAFELGHSEQFLLVNGGPGTGKSHVAISLIMDFLLLYPEVKILVTAPTNQALESLFMRLLDHPYYDKYLYDNYNQVILPSNTYIDSGRGNAFASQFFVDTLCEEWKQEYNVEESNDITVMEKSSKNLLSKARLVFTTFSTAGNPILSDQKFPIVIIDDVAQPREPDTIVPLQYGCQKLILFGDFNQLNPLEHHSEIQKEFGITMFNRLFSYGGQDQVSRVQLVTQNRMRPSLMNLIGVLNYGDKAEQYYRLGEKGKNKQWLPVIFPFPNNEEQYVWLDVVGEETNALSTYSLVNQEEADVLENVYRKMLALEILIEDIGVFAAYKSQANFIQNQLIEKFSDQAPHVYTVDTVQGMEKKYVIISLVRGGEHIGFMEVLNRVSTALSRSEEGLIIIGNWRPFYASDVKFWERLIKYMKDKNTIRNAKSFLEQLN